MPDPGSRENFIPFRRSALMRRCVTEGKLDEADTERFRQLGKLVAALYHHEFHDRFESIVTVGSFDTVGTPSPNGKLNLHPAVYNIMKTYGAERINLPNNGQGVQPRQLGEIRFDVQPMPIEVPRKSLGSDYVLGHRD